MLISTSNSVSLKKPLSHKFEFSQNISFFPPKSFHSHFICSQLFVPIILTRTERIIVVTAYKSQDPLNILLIIDHENEILTYISYYRPSKNETIYQL